MYEVILCYNSNKFRTSSRISKIQSLLIRSVKRYINGLTTYYSKWVARRSSLISTIRWILSQKRDFLFIIIMLGVFSERFVVFMSFFFIRDIISLNVNLYFERNEAFKDLLPIHGDVNYIYTKNDLSMFECAGNCEFCSGFLYNSGSRTCHLLKTLLNETIFNRSRVDIGWELYESLNGMLRTC